MALALRQAAPLKPELRLAQAISEFEADLSDEQKMRFRKDKSQSPRSDDVMRLTAEIDRCMLLQGNRRCYGPRLTNFLQGVQQFASIGDIVIGGSQFLPACGVWTLVRFSLLSIVQHRSYVDSMSLMFMEIGRSAPSYQRMALLYPQSRHLQANVLEYFILVVQLCHRMLKYSKKSSLKQFFDSTYNSSSTDRKDLEKWSLAIRDEMHIAMARENQDESQKSSAFRFTWRQDLDQRQSYHQQTTKFNVLDAISTYDYRATWKQFRKVGNTTVLTGNDEYLVWKNHSKSSTLVLSGQLGAGKSIVLTNMVDDLFLNRVNSAQVVYFFCRHDTPESLMARTIIGAMARQLLEDVDPSTLPSELIRDRYSVDDITCIIFKLFTSHSKAYMILDGIYECDTENQSEVFNFLAVLQSRLLISVCISTRKQQALTATTTASFALPIYIKMPSKNPDIELYIEQELESLLASGKMVVQDPHVVLEIRDQLMLKSEGMFLWVYLQILLLCFENSDHGIRQVLKELPLPEDLATTYTRLLDRTTTTTIMKSSIRARFLSLIVAAFRPLTVKELQEGLSITPGDTSWDASKLVNNTETVFSACSGLLVFDEEQETIRYLDDDVHEVMAYTILTYLNLPIFETSVSRTVVPIMDVKLVPAGIIVSGLQPSTRVQQLAIKLLKTRTTKEQDISRTLAEHRQKVVYKSDFQFQHYARKYWFLHLCEAETFNSTASELLVRLLQSEKLSLEDNEKIVEHVSHSCKSWVLTLIKEMSYVDTGPIWQFCLLCLAVEQGHIPLVELLLGDSSVDPNCGLAYKIHPLKIAIESKNGDVVSSLLKSDKICCDWRPHKIDSPLEIALYLGLHNIASILLRDNRIDPNEWTTGKPATLLTWAVQKRNFPAAKLLLECTRTNKNDKLDPNIKDIYGRAPLHLACQLGNKYAVKLLASDDRVDLNARCSEGKTALWIAIEQDSFECLRMLLWEYISSKKCVLRKGLNPNIPDENGQTPLHLACQLGNRYAVKLLASDDRVDLNARCSKGKTALWIAIEQDSFECLRILLWEHTVSKNHVLPSSPDPNIPDEDGLTPLHLAVSRGRLKIVKELLERLNFDILNVNAQDRTGQTPLHLAVSQGKLEIVRELLDLGILDVNILDKQHQAPLHLAVSQGRLEIVRALLDLKILNVNVQDRTGQTPLHLAVSQGKLEIVKELLDLGILDVNILDKQHQAPLHLAILQGKLEIVRALLDLKILSVNIQDRTGQTPLHLAVLRRRLDVVKELLNTGRVSITQQNNTGFTALNLAEISEWNEAIALISDYQSRNIIIDFRTRQREFLAKAAKIQEQALD